MGVCDFLMLLYIFYLFGLPGFGLMMSEISNDILPVGPHLT